MCSSVATRSSLTARRGVFSSSGGVVNSQCCVVAGLIYRSLSLVHYTTPTMGTFDVAVDFKLAVKHPSGKNLLGCCNRASVTIMDVECLASLSFQVLGNSEDFKKCTFEKKTRENKIRSMISRFSVFDVCTPRTSRNSPYPRSC